MFLRSKSLHSRAGQELILKAKGQASFPRSCRRSSFLCHAVMGLIIKEMPCPAKCIETSRPASLIHGACRPGRLISVLLSARFRITWISPLLAAAFRAFPRRRGCAGLLRGGPSWCWTLLRSVTALVAAQAAWRLRRLRRVASRASAMCSLAIGEFSATCGLTRD